ncbi:MAG: hypothetical protein CMP11_05835 [Zetaproteobacteria bacterium]|nr:hypothetical protein [Pseudobdellovibrionaceae bacterium]
MRKICLFILKILILNHLFIATKIFSQEIIFDNSGQNHSYWGENIESSYQNHQEQISIYNFIDRAQHSIYVEIYEMYDDTIKDLLIEKARLGLDVRVLVEPKPVSNSCDGLSKKTKDNFKCQKSSDFIRALKEASRKNKKIMLKDPVRYFNKSLCNGNCFQHGKIIISDNKEVLVSTGNFSENGLCYGKKRQSGTCHRDFSIISNKVEAVETFNLVFNLDFENSKYNLSSKEEIDFLRESMGEKISQHLREGGVEESVMVSPYNSDIVLKLIDEAQDKIQMQAQYIKHPEWQKSILNALDRNVDVEVTLPSLCYFNRNSNDMGWIKSKEFESSGYYTKWLLPIINHPSKKGKIRFFTASLPDYGKGGMGYIHSKVILVDDKKAWIGSTNGSVTSTNFNREFGLVTEDSHQILYLKNIIDDDFSHASSIYQHVPEINGPLPEGFKFPRGTCKISQSSSKVSWSKMTILKRKRLSE